ncbi:hypothetical protein HK097_003919, partial [Rhizophlyctis rosea]
MRVDPNILAQIPLTVPHRKGNWIEESVLREQLVREFIEKNRNGVDDGGARGGDVRGAPQVELSPQLQYEGNIMIRNSGTSSALTILGPVPTRISPSTFVPIPLTTSRTTAPTNHTVFRLMRCPEYERSAGGSGDRDMRIRYGERFYVVWEGGERPFYLYSEPKSFLLASKVGKRQTAVLGPDADHRAVWELQWADASMRMEMEGAVVD